jgi:NTP pyrophosphatase (non-canonical NTP hydrolase)
MEKEEKLGLYDKAIKTWGIEAQRNMAFEEIGELLVALAQDRRGRVTKEEIITELADVTIMCEQLATILGYDDYEKELDRKLIRLRDEKLAKYGDNN